MDNQNTNYLPLSTHSFGKVAVLFGGRSAEREVSLKTRLNIVDAFCCMQVAAPSRRGIGGTKRYCRCAARS